MVKRGNRVVTQLLIKWKGEKPIDATWEDFQFNKEKFSDFDLIVEIVLKGGRVSETVLGTLSQDR